MNRVARMGCRWAALLVGWAWLAHAAQGMDEEFSTSAVGKVAAARTAQRQEYLAIVSQIRLKNDAAPGLPLAREVSSNTLALSKDPALSHLVETYHFLLEHQASNGPAASSPVTGAALLLPLADRARSSTRDADLAVRAAILSRNLYFRGATPRRDEMAKVWRTLETNRAWAKAQLTFNGRNVLTIANGQTYGSRFAGEPAKARQWTRQSGGDDFYFGKSSLTNFCARLAGRTGRLSFYRPDEPDPGSARALKPRVLQQIAAATNQIHGEFIALLGHAVDSQFLLEGETIQDNDVSACISSSELAEALKRSFAGASVDPRVPANWKIVVLAACHSQEYLRQVHERLRQTPGLAVFVADTEYGQMDYWTPTPLGSQFLEALFGYTRTTRNPEALSPTPVGDDVRSLPMNRTVPAWSSPSPPATRGERAGETGEPGSGLPSAAFRSLEILSLGTLMDKEPRLRWGKPSIFLRVQDAHGRWLLQQVM